LTPRALCKDEVSLTLHHANLKVSRPPYLVTSSSAIIFVGLVPERRGSASPCDLVVIARYRPFSFENMDGTIDLGTTDSGVIGILRIELASAVHRLTLRIVCSFLSSSLTAAATGPRSRRQTPASAILDFPAALPSPVSIVAPEAPASNLGRDVAYNRVAN
jgi:hypothetical protein